jgi:hypothetical protein
MSKKIISVSEDTSVEEIARLMTAHTIKRLPVMKDGAIVGIVSRASIVQRHRSRRTCGDPHADLRSLKSSPSAIKRLSLIRRHSSFTGNGNKEARRLASCGRWTKFSVFRRFAYASADLTISASRRFHAASLPETVPN